MDKLRISKLVQTKKFLNQKANLWLKILQLSNRAAKKQTSGEKKPLRELINTPHLAGELE